METLCFLWGVFYISNFSLYFHENCAQYTPYQFYVPSQHQPASSLLSRSITHSVDTESWNKHDDRVVSCRKPATLLPPSRSAHNRTYFCVRSDCRTELCCCEDGTELCCCEDGTELYCCEDGAGLCCCEDGTELCCCEDGTELCFCEDVAGLCYCEDGTELCCCEDGTELCYCEDGNELSCCEDGTELCCCEDGTELCCCEE